jgi:UDP-N-acetylmuramoyl-tripeptide--D-alanyl-D-alanine ligase
MRVSLVASHPLFFYLWHLPIQNMHSTEEIYRIFLEHPSISTDSRQIKPGSVFFALKGDQYDGNRFASDAIAKGAAYAVVDNPGKASGDRFIPVEDTLISLQNLASTHRKHITAKIIGITGSNGKTTTKELIGKVLSTSYQTVMTRGNLNNHIGVPLTMLSITKETEFAVVEMGANHPGEIANLCQIARPDYGIITNIGKAHLEGFGSLEGVARAKSELYDFLRNNNGLAFINSDNPILMGLTKGLNYFSYGTAGDTDCTGSITSRDPFLSVKWHGRHFSGTVRSLLYGDYNLENVLAAISIGTYFNIEPAKIEDAISSYQPDNNRSQWIKTGSNLVILDAYNANPSSMKAALLNFHQMAASPKIAILGDMMELGEHSLTEHREVISLARELSFDRLFLIGNQFRQACSPGNETSFRDIGQAKDWFRENRVHGMSVLLKGSRKMRLEALIELL